MFNALLAEDYNCLITDLHESKRKPQTTKHMAKILRDTRRWQDGAEQTEYRMKQRTEGKNTYTYPHRGPIREMETGWRMRQS